MFSFVTIMATNHNDDGIIMINQTEGGVPTWPAFSFTIMQPDWAVVGEIIALVV